MLDQVDGAEFVDEAHPHDIGHLHGMQHLERAPAADILAECLANRALPTLGPMVG